MGEQTLPQLTQQSRENAEGRVSAALVWPVGHTQLGGSLGLVILLYLLLIFSFLLQDLTKQPLIVGFNRLIWEDSFQPIFNLSQDFALIP